MEAVAAAGRRADRPVRDLLFEEEYRFDFYQAVRLLELLSPDAGPVGEGTEPENEVVRFRSATGLGFPSSDVVRVGSSDDGDGPWAMTVSFLGLAGGLSPLPRSVTELLLKRAARGDTALRDFLDIFNHRLVSLMYRVRKKHRLALATVSPERTELAGHLYALMGLGTPELRGRLGVEDRSLLEYAGLFAQRPRSMVGLEQLLTDYFGVPVKGEQFRGRWLELEEDQRTRIGRLGENNALGEGAVLGSRVWDQQGSFELCVGPLTLEQLRDFLPTGTAFRPLNELTRFYVGTELDFTIRLVLQTPEVPWSRLGAAGTTRLGQTSWLKTQPFEEELRMLTKQDIQAVRDLAMDAADAATDAAESPQVQTRLGNAYAAAEEILQDFQSWKVRDDVGFLREEPSALAQAVAAVLAELLAVRNLGGLSPETAAVLNRLNHPDPCVGPGNMLVPAYRSGDAIRKLFYGGFSQAAKTYVRGIVNASVGLHYTCPGVPFGTHPPYNIAPHPASKQDYTIDHVKPVARHWNQKGRDMSRAARNQWLNKTSNLVPICSSCNTIKGSWYQGVQHNYNTVVGPNFTGMF
ncbi:MAG TPA: type VI secretion system baseplate subunit TssG [Longimicrobiaceae bacterium]|nr:type VI secretion system baseplate subunit TssG [Longimicrobiaceae bacterium]